MAPLVVTVEKTAHAVTHIFPQVANISIPQTVFRRTYKGFALVKSLLLGKT